MRSKVSNALSNSLVALALIGSIAGPTAAADAYQAQSFSAPPPEELSGTVRDALSTSATRILGAQGPLCEIWIRKAVPTQPSAAPALGIVYTQLAEGTLVGAIRIATQSTDYRSQQIKPSVYTMRYALLPVDGNHQGVAPNRDFLLLVPATLDPSPTTLTRDDLLQLSRKASGTSHPSVWSLPQVDSPPASVPSLIHQADSDLWILFFHLTPEGGGAPLTVGLVVVGRAPEA